MAPFSESTQPQCLVCRHRKDRCDRIKPECGFCSKGGLQCEYTTARKTPGLRAGYVEKLEKRLGCLERDFQAFKENIDPHGSRYLIAGTGAETVSRLSAPPRATGLGSQLSMSNGPVLGSSVAATSPSRPFNGRSQDKVTEARNLWFQKHHSWFTILHEPTMMEARAKYSEKHESPVTVVLEAITAVVTSTNRRAAHGNDTGRSGELDERATFRRPDPTTCDPSPVSSHTTSPTHPCHRLNEHAARPPRSGGTQVYELRLPIRDPLPHSSHYRPQPSSKKRRSAPFGPLRPWIRRRLSDPRGISPSPSRYQQPVFRATKRYSGVPSPSYPCTSLGTRKHRHPSPSLSGSRSNEMWHVHQFLQQPCDTTSVSDLQQRELDCTIVYERLMTWHRDFEQMRTVRTPPYTVHSAVVSLHQRLIFPDDDTASEHSWKDAAERCLTSCDEMIKVIRGAGDDMLETANPHIIHCVFVAARFNIVYNRVLGLGPPNKVWLLIYGLRICGQRWPLARQLLKVLEAAAGTEGYGG
ncbi:hypothetical protein CSAL01_08496, partial [Colletotrichum salicis]